MERNTYFQIFRMLIFQHFNLFRVTFFPHISLFYAINLKIWKKVIWSSTSTLDYFFLTACSLAICLDSLKIPVRGDSISVNDNVITIITIILFKTVHHVANFKHSKSIIDFNQIARLTIMPVFKCLINSDNYQDEKPCQSKEK